MRDHPVTESRSPVQGEGIRELQARLYREIGVLAVARALELEEFLPGRYELASRPAATSENAAPHIAAMRRERAA